MSSKKKTSASGGLANKFKNMTDTNLLLTITIVVFLLMYIGAVIFLGSGFRKPQTFFNILNAQAALIILSCGMSLVMITKGIDISIGGVTALVCMCCAVVDIISKFIDRTHAGYNNTSPFQSNKRFILYIERISIDNCRHTAGKEHTGQCNDKRLNLQIGDQSSGSPSHATGAEMNAIASSIIGGTMLTGGVGNIFGTFVGVLSLSTIQNIVSSAGLDDAW